MRQVGGGVVRAVVAVTLVALVSVTGCSDDEGTSDTGGGSTTDPSTESTTESSPAVEAPDATTIEEVLALDRPVVLAHAGGENAHPHSTPFAYGESVTAGVDILDFDVRLTGDGVLVVHHDEDVDRTTDGTGLVSEMTYEELHDLDAAYWFTPDCSACEDQPADEYVFRGIRTGDVEPPEGYEPDDFAVTSFEEIIEKYPDHPLNVEIKGSYPADVPAAEELARILTEAGRLDQAVVTAFDDDLAEAFSEAAPTVEITAGLEAMTAYVLGGQPLGEDREIVQIPPEYEGIELVTADFVKRAHGDGLVMWVWPNSREWENAQGYDRLFDLGVDGINAADPPTAVEVLGTR